MTSDPHSTANQYKGIVRRIFEEVWMNENFDILADLVAPQFTYHFRGKAFEQVPANLVELVRSWKAAFPDLHFEVGELVAEGNLVAARVVYRGTQQREWKGIAAEGRRIQVDEMMMFRFEQGRIVEVWEVADELAERQQLLGTGD